MKMKNCGRKVNQMPIFFKQITEIVKPWYSNLIKQVGIEIYIAVDFEVGSQSEYEREQYKVHDTI